jgi:hypothetical protein
VKEKSTQLNLDDATENNVPVEPMNGSAHNDNLEAVPREAITLPNFHPDHLADLRKSGLSDETIIEAKIQTVVPRDISKILGWNPSAVTSCYGIPYPGNGFLRYRCFYAEDKPGPRYLQRKDSGCHLYVPPVIDEAVLDDSSKALYITEGEKKALKASQEGLPCLGLGGLWNWRHNGKLIDDFDRISFKGREVLIVPDNDWLKPNKHGYKKNLRQAVHGLAYALIERGAVVSVIMLPDQESKVGLDDYLCAYPLDQFHAMPRKPIRKLSIEDAIAEASKEDLPEILGRLLRVEGESERELYISALSKRLGVSRGALKKDLKARAEKEKRPLDGNVLIAHPSYEMNPDFLSLGFRETVVLGGQIEDRNFYLISRGGAIAVEDGPVMDIDSRRVVVELRDRTLMRLQDRWSREDLADFRAHPLPPEAVYCKIKEILEGYLELQTPGHYGLFASWIIATYFHRLFNAMPFVFLYGKKQSGKSRGLDLIERLAFNAFKTKGITVASMADSLDGIRGTLAIDQAELLSDKNHLELLGILADSYTPGGGRRRVVNITPKGRRVLEFETYGPKAFASIQDLDDDLRDRCIFIPMLRAKKEYPYPEAFLPVWPEMRAILYRMLLTRWPEAKLIYQDAGNGMVHRIKELWKPLETILTMEKVPDLERAEIKRAFLEAMKETQAELSEQEDLLFSALFRLLEERGQADLTVQEIANAMKDVDGLFVSDKAKTTWVGQVLKRFSMYDKKLPKKTGKHPYRLSLERVREIHHRYSGTETGDNTDDVLGDHGLDHEES